jgi:hypothetical protein
MSWNERIRNESFGAAAKRVAIGSMPDFLRPLARDVYRTFKDRDLIVYPHQRSLNLAGSEIDFNVRGPYESRLIRYLESETEYIGWMCEVVEGFMYKIALQF